MAATSGHVSVVIADCRCVQHWHRRSDSEARQNRFLFRIFTHVALHSRPSDGCQQAGVSIDYYRRTIYLLIASLNRQTTYRPNYSGVPIGRQPIRELFSHSRPFPVSFLIHCLNSPLLSSLDLFPSEHWPPDPLNEQWRWRKPTAVECWNSPNELIKLPPAELHQVSICV